LFLNKKGNAVTNGNCLNLQEGGPGSGRYPEGSGQSLDQVTKVSSALDDALANEKKIENQILKMQKENPGFFNDPAYLQLAKEYKTAKVRRQKATRDAEKTVKNKIEGQEMKQSIKTLKIFGVSLFKESMKEGGPGSGRYPKGSGKGKDDKGKSADFHLNKSKSILKQMKVKMEKARSMLDPKSRPINADGSPVYGPRSPFYTGYQPKPELAADFQKLKNEHAALSAEFDYHIDQWKAKQKDENQPQKQSDKSLKIFGVSILREAAKLKESECDAEINKLLVDNPNMSAPTFLNLLKSKGFEIAKKNLNPSEQVELKQADSASAFPQVTRAQDTKQESEKLKFSCSLMESDKPKDPRVGPQKYKTVLLSEGLGNMVDRFYYTKQALESAVPIFEGAKIFSDHPSADEEMTRPERSVRDVLGHFETVHIERDNDGRSLLVADCVPVAGESFVWAKDLMSHAVQYSKKFPDRDFIGLSINADGAAQESDIDLAIKSEATPESVKLKLSKAKEKGIKTIKIVSAISDATSCDLVTKAGAGGKVLTLIESN